MFVCKYLFLPLFLKHNSTESLILLELWRYDNVLASIPCGEAAVNLIVDPLEVSLGIFCFWLLLDLFGVLLSQYIFYRYKFLFINLDGRLLGIRELLFPINSQKFSTVSRQTLFSLLLLPHPGKQMRYTLYFLILWP